MTSGLTSFLLARIAEKERAARQAGERRNAEVLATASAFGQSFMVVGDALDPRRALDECVAVRRIVELHPTHSWSENRVVDRVNGVGHMQRVDVVMCNGCKDFSDSHLSKGSTDGETGEWVYPCTTLRILAAVYADHPNYRQEWKP